MSIYESIGGEAAVSEVVERFYANLRCDPIVGMFFEGDDLGGLKSHQRMFLTAALGGPDAYEGRDMRAAHRHLGITDADFDVFVSHLAQALADLEATPEHVADVLAAIGPLRQQIVCAPCSEPDGWGTTDPPGGSG
jgi:hemoglobin